MPNTQTIQNVQNVQNVQNIQNVQHPLQPGQGMQQPMPAQTAVQGGMQMPENGVQMGQNSMQMPRNGGQMGQNSMQTPRNGGQTGQGGTQMSQEGGQTGQGGTQMSQDGGQTGQGGTQMPWNGGQADQGGMQMDQTSPLTDWSSEITPPEGGVSVSRADPHPRMRPAMRSELAGSTGQLDLRNHVPDEVIEAPTTVSEAYLGSMKGMLARNKGNFVVATFLIGTQGTTTWEGLLYEVGNDYLIIHQSGRDRFIACDMYALKYIEFYDTQRKELCDSLMWQNGWQDGC